MCIYVPVCMFVRVCECLCIRLCILQQNYVTSSSKIYAIKYKEYNSDQLGQRKLTLRSRLTIHILHIRDPITRQIPLSGQRIPNSKCFYLSFFGQYHKRSTDKQKKYIHAIIQTKTELSFKNYAHAQTYSMA